MKFGFIWAVVVTVVLSLATLFGCSPVGEQTDNWQAPPATPTPYPSGEVTPTPGDNFFEVYADQGEDEGIPAHWVQFFGTSAAGDVIPASGIQIDGDFSFEYRSCKYYTQASCGPGLVIHGSISIPYVWEYDTSENGGVYASRFSSVEYYPRGWFVGEIKAQKMVLIGWIVADPDLDDAEWASDNPNAELNEFFGVLYYGLLEQIKTRDPADAASYLKALGQLKLPRAK